MLNIVTMLKEIEIRCQNSHNSIMFMGDVKDTNIYEILHINKESHWGDSRFWVANTNYFKNEMIGIYREMDDNIYGKYAEDIIYNFAKKHKGQIGFIFRFKHQVQFGGIDGLWDSAQIHDRRLQKDSLKQRIKNKVHYIIRLLFPNIWI